MIRKGTLLEGCDFTMTGHSRKGKYFKCEKEKEQGYNEEERNGQHL